MVRVNGDVSGCVDGGFKTVLSIILYVGVGWLLTAVWMVDPLRVWLRTVSVPLLSIWYTLLTELTTKAAFNTMVTSLTLLLFCVCSNVSV